MLLMQCYPKHCCGLPIGLKEKHFFKISNSMNYGKAQHQGDSFCSFLIDCLLCFDEMFLHSQESRVRVAGSIVHCPWRVGGKGHYNDQFATETTNNLLTNTEQQNGLMTSESSALPAAAAAVSEDIGLSKLKSDLIALPNPPGLPFVCQKLAEGLAGYGICSLQELFEIRDRNYNDAATILGELKWSSLQVCKVLGYPP
jgi:hypothetical protein